VVKFFPDFPYPDVTIELLLCHRSGLPNYIYFTDKYVRDKQTPLTNSFVVTLMSSLKPPPYFLPDRTFNYSNTGYAVLAAIVEKVTKLSYPEFVRKEIFQPLGMTHSGFAEWHPSDSLDRAVGYNRGWNEAAFTFLDGVMGDKGIYASPGDLFLWDQGLYKGTILSTHTLRDAFEPRGKKADSKKNYGFGWRMMKLEDKTQILYHTGWWEGFQTLLVRIPKDRTTIVVLKNRKAGIIDKAAILKVLYPESFKAQKLEDLREEELEGGEFRRGD
jgi:CubicO group peptidase (beta-lactamase class C family)